MHDKWIELCDDYGVKVREANKLWTMLESLYTTPGRHYHTLEHVIEMAEALSRLTDYADNYAAVHIAVWFHDAVYNSRRSDNEDLSAELMRLCLRGSFDLNDIQVAGDLIRVTKNHKPLKNTDDELIVDLDLMRFADPWEKFLENNENIRKEYFWVPEDVYTIKRRQVLEYFRDMDPMFFTPLFKERYEELARNNINRLLGMKAWS